VIVLALGGIADAHAQSIFEGKPSGNRRVVRERTETRQWAEADRAFL